MKVAFKRLNALRKFAAVFGVEIDIENLDIAQFTIVKYRVK